VEYAEIDGSRVAYRRAGSGPPLLLLHGAVSDSRVWRVELDAFATDFAVIAWDAPGCGESDDAPPAWRMPDYARCLARLLDALDVAPAHVVGHSWGSTLALELCLLRPDRVRSLVLVGGYAGWAGSLPAEEVDRRLQFAMQAADALPASFDPSTMPGLFSDVMPADRAAELATVMSDIRAPGTRTMAQALAACDLRERLPSIGVPTLVLAGEHDVRSPLPVAEALVAGIPNSRLAVLPGLGHECYLESSETFERRVRQFLDSLQRSAG
jgi:pimeloyl-ACP methyl ester carboxylesterase